MRNNIFAELRRSLTAYLVLAIIILMAFSSFYLANSTHHHCDGEDCHICQTIKQCKCNIRHIGSGIIMHTVILGSVAFMYIADIIFVYEADNITLVSRKVRLND